MDDEPPGFSGIDGAASSSATASSRPFFLYSENFECYRYCGYSYGDGIFLRLNTLAHDNLASFVVAKDHRRKSLVVKIKSAALKKFLHNAIRPDHQHVDMWPGEAPKESIRDTYSFEQLLSHYGQYRSYLSEIGMTACFSSFGKILTLFTRDFLLDLSIWRFFASKTTSFGHRLIDSSHWKDMRRWSMEKDLDDFTMLFNVHGGDRTHRDALDDAHLLIAVEAGDIQQVYDLLAQRYKPVEWEHLTAALNGCHRSVFGVLWQNFHLNDNLHALQATAVAAAMKGWLVELGMVVGRLEQQNFILPPVHHSLPELRYTRTLLFHDIVAAATRGGHCHVLAACFGFDGRTIPPYNSWGHSNPSRRDHFDDSGIPLIEFIVTTACDSGRGDVLDWLKTANWPDLGCIFSGITIQRCVKDYLRRLDTSRITTHSKYESRLDATQTSRSATRLNMKYDGHLSELMDVNMNAKQGCMMREGVRNRFLLQHSNFVRKLNSTLACGLLRKFQRSLSEPRTVWRQGIDTIRSLVSNVPPGNIADVFCCIQVSRAIRRSLRSRGKLIQLPTEDLADLKRWMSVLPEEQRRLFALVSQTLWNSKLVRDCIHGHDSVLSHCEECSLEPCENWRLCDEDALSHFQKMFETLMIETRNAGLFREGSEAQQGERLSEIQARYGGDPGGTPARGQSPAALSHWSTPPHQRPPDPPYPREDIEASSTLAQPRVVMLAATSMFMVIIALLVLLYHIHPIPVSPETLLQFATSGSLRHYTYIFAVYYGISPELPAPDVTGVTGINVINPQVLPGTTNVVARGIPQEDSPSWWSSGSQVLADDIPLLTFPIGLPVKGMNAFDAWNEWSPNHVQRTTNQTSSSPNSTTPLTQSPGSSNTPTQSTVQSTPAALANPPRSVSRQECPHCHRTFSNVGNLNKHIRSDCRQLDRAQRQIFRCRNPGCGRTLTREAYRVKHEKEKCLRR